MTLLMLVLLGDSRVRIAASPIQVTVSGLCDDFFCQWPQEFEKPSSTPTSSPASVRPKDRSRQIETKISIN